MGPTAQGPSQGLSSQQTLSTEATPEAPATATPRLTPAAPPSPTPPRPTL